MLSENRTIHPYWRLFGGAFSRLTYYDHRKRKRRIDSERIRLRNKVAEKEKFPLCNVYVINSRTNYRRSFGMNPLSGRVAFGDLLAIT